jgi:hypothetical protein
MCGTATTTHGDTPTLNSLRRVQLAAATAAVGVAGDEQGLETVASRALDRYVCFSYFFIKCLLTTTRLRRHYVYRTKKKTNTTSCHVTSATSQGRPLRQVLDGLYYNFVDKECKNCLRDVVRCFLGLRLVFLFIFFIQFFYFLIYFLR